jgi:hypothetical protein
MGLVAVPSELSATLTLGLLTDSPITLSGCSGGAAFRLPHGVDQQIGP